MYYVNYLLLLHIFRYYMFFICWHRLLCRHLVFFPKSHTDQKTDPQTGRRGRKGLGREVVFWPEIWAVNSLRALAPSCTPDNQNRAVRALKTKLLSGTSNDTWPPPSGRQIPLWHMSPRNTIAIVIAQKPPDSSQSWRHELNSSMSTRHSAWTGPLLEHERGR